MNPVIYVNHETAEVYQTHRQAMEAYRAGTQIDLYKWNMELSEWTYAGYWEV